ncbi:MAG: acyl-CoA dehydrogenase family protein, partial [Halioglobus sp.]|nr:acyl-CoA dehydrogenase family protein [Halioglobus sp.]
LLGVSIDEAHGGMGFDFEALCLLIEEAGKTLPPVPLIPVLTAAMTLQQYAAAEQRERWLPGIAAGNLLVTTALSEPASDDPCTPSAGLQASGEGWLLFGCKHMVVAADQADAMLLSARFGNELVLLAVATTAVGISVVAQEVTTGEPQFTVTFDSVRVSRSDIIARGADAHCALESLVQHTLVASACMTLGVTETMLRLTAGYTAEREQFGRPIATFQAVSHRAADAFIDVENLRLACQQAASLLSKQSDATQAVMIAKIWASDVAHRVSQSSQHLHGGIGVDRDYPLFRYCLWAKQLELTLGGGNAYLMRLGDAIAQEFTRRAAKPLLDSNAA